MADQDDDDEEDFDNLNNVDKMNSGGTKYVLMFFSLSKNKQKITRQGWGLKLF